MISTSTLILGVIFGAIGLGFFVYGKKQKAIIPLFLRYSIDDTSIFYSKYVYSDPFRYYYSSDTLFYQDIRYYSKGRKRYSDMILS